MLPRRKKTTTQNPLLAFAKIVIPYLAPIHEESEEHEAVTQQLVVEEKGEVAPQEPSSTSGGEATPQEPTSPEHQ